VSGDRLSAIGCQPEHSSCMLATSVLPDRRTLIADRCPRERTDTSER
jgi:hypothetical protein